ncbi:MAG: DUF4177 domain-containing protein [Marinovum sp.]|nr:DUF4177 domain-containing protein [Marinovum sp.]
MNLYEYKVIAAPSKGLKAKGLKTPNMRLAAALQEALNQESSDGWEYVRAETLPSEERQGLTGSTTGFRNVLVFRRSVVIDKDAAADIGAEPEPLFDHDAASNADTTDMGASEEPEVSEQAPDWPRT